MIPKFSPLLIRGAHFNQLPPKRTLHFFTMALIRFRFSSANRNVPQIFSCITCSYGIACFVGLHSLLNTSLHHHHHLTLPTYRQVEGELPSWTFYFLPKTLCHMILIYPTCKSWSSPIKTSYFVPTYTPDTYSPIPCSSQGVDTPVIFNREEGGVV